MTTLEQQQLITELSRDILTQIAPQELPLFRATSATYFKNPESLFKPDKDKDEMLGFAVGEAMVLMTPSVLMTVNHIIQFLTNEIQKSVATESKGLISILVKKMFKKFRSNNASDPDLIFLLLPWIDQTSPLSFLIFVCLISLWAIPMLAFLWRRRAAKSVEASWILPGPSSQPLTISSSEPARPGLALLAGTVGGLLFCGLVLVLHSYLRDTVSEAIRATAQYNSALFYWQTTYAILIQLYVAVFIACWVRRMSEIHALFAACVASCIAAIEMLIHNTLSGGQVDPGLVSLVFLSIINPGGLLVLVLAAGVSLLAKRTGPVMRIGVAGGLIYSGMVLTADVLWTAFQYYVLHNAQSGEISNTEVFGIVILLQVLFQISVGVLSLIQTTRLNVVKALLVMFISGCVGNASWLFSSRLSQNYLEVYSSSFLFGMLCAFVGALLTLPVALLIAFLIRKLRLKITQRTAPHPSS